MVFSEKRYFADGSFQEIKIWKVPERKHKSCGLKYSFAYIVGDKRVVGYDNHERKGDHRYYLDKEYPYDFEGLDKLRQDFKDDIERFREGNL